MSDLSHMPVLRIAADEDQFASTPQTLYSGGCGVVRYNVLWQVTPRTPEQMFRSSCEMGKRGA